MGRRDGAGRRQVQGNHREVRPRWRRLLWLGQALTGETYVANKLFKAGIRTNTVEGNPRLCMASAVGGYITTFGKDEPMGCYEDIDYADVFFL